MRGLSQGLGPLTCNLTNTTTPAESGYGTGLSIIVDTSNSGGQLPPTLRVKHQGAIIVEQLVPGILSGQFNSLVIDIQNETLALSCNGALLTNLTLPGWQPLPEWQFALGARSGASADPLQIDNLLIGQRASSLLLPASSPVATLALRPIVPELTDLAFALQDNSNPAFASASFDTNQHVNIVATTNTLGSAIFSFAATNSSQSMLVPFSIHTVQPRISSISYSTNDAPEFRLSGPPSARYYLQQTDSLAPAQWTTIATDSLDSLGQGTVQALPFSSAPARWYRVVFTQ